ncbi:hypothetical protein ABIA88_001447 [Bradyrhizobium sp. LA6.4]
MKFICSAFEYGSGRPTPLRNKLRDAASQKPSKFHCEPRQPRLSWHTNTDIGNQRGALDRSSYKLLPLDFQRGTSKSHDGRSKTSFHHRFGKGDTVDLKSKVQARIVLNCGAFKKPSVAVRQAWQNERNIAQVLKANPFRGFGAIGVGRYENHSLMQYREHVDTIQRGRIVQHRYVDSSALKPFFKRRADPFTNDKRGVRPSRLEYPEYLGSDKQAGRWCKAQSNVAGEGVTGAANEVQRARQVFNDILSLTEEQRPGFGKFNAALSALEQLNTEFLLKLLDLSTESRLSDVEVCGSPAETSSARNVRKVSQFANVHRTFPPLLNKNTLAKPNRQ